MKVVKEPPSQKNAYQDLINHRKEVGKLKSELKMERQKSETLKEHSKSTLSSL